MHLYFGKNVNALDIAQCAALTSIIPSPNLTYNPHKHPENVRARSKLVLKNMLNQGMITEAQYAESANEKLAFMPQKD